MLDDREQVGEHANAVDDLARGVGLELGELHHRRAHLPGPGVAGHERREVRVVAVEELERPVERRRGALLRLLERLASRTSLERLADRRQDGLQIVQGLRLAGRRDTGGSGRGQRLGAELHELTARPRERLDELGGGWGADLFESPGGLVQTGTEVHEALGQCRQLAGNLVEVRFHPRPKGPRQF
jgi:hypothetical protein